MPAGADAGDARSDLPEGGYAVRGRGDGVRTAVEVLADPVARMRYGFVAELPARP